LHQRLLLLSRNSERKRESRCAALSRERVRRASEAAGFSIPSPQPSPASGRGSESSCPPASCPIPTVCVRPSPASGRASASSCPPASSLIPPVCVLPSLASGRGGASEAAGEFSIPSPQRSPATGRGNASSCPPASSLIPPVCVLPSPARRADPGPGCSVSWCAPASALRNPLCSPLPRAGEGPGVRDRPCSHSMREWRRRSARFHSPLSAKPDTARARPPASDQFPHPPRSRACIYFDASDAFSFIISGRPDDAPRVISASRA